MVVVVMVGVEGNGSVGILEGNKDNKEMGWRDSFVWKGQASGSGEGGMNMNDGGAKGV